ncbi:MAG: RdgB/HAM1 family non-canonical purine NTP pyrophosphatase [Saprospiraceae bacterium]|nr:RdgB/HAM1 family non-canonical purine NTP pyrophosphatase [Saprospiraceae bacterium]
MKNLVFATNNPHKIAEVKAIIGPDFAIRSLQDIGCHEELPETTDTIPGNALQKAQYVYDHYGVDCFAEDTGLEIEALGGAPGVHTAYYAGPQRSAEDNYNLVLSQLQGQSNRRAQFRTVIALILGGKVFTFEGIAPGRIAEQPAGEGGFGYDPVFIPDGYDQPFANLPYEVKNSISHRAKAMEGLLSFLAKL